MTVQSQCYPGVGGAADSFVSNQNQGLTFAVGLNQREAPKIGLAASMNFIRHRRKLRVVARILYCPAKSADENRRKFKICKSLRVRVSISINP